MQENLSLSDKPSFDYRPSLSSYPKDSYLRRGNFLHRYTDRGASTGCLCQTHEGGAQSFIIAHRLSTIQDADLILVLVDGDIVDMVTIMTFYDLERAVLPNAESCSFSSE